MQLPQTIAFRSLIFILVGTLLLVLSVSWSVYNVSHRAIEANVEHKLILEGEYLTKRFLTTQKRFRSKEQYKALLQELADAITGYAYLINEKGELLLASDEAIVKKWQEVYAKIKTLNKPHPYKHYIKFKRFIIDDDPFFHQKSFGVIYELEGTPGYKIVMAVAYDRAFAPATQIL